jgi:hypothetical protein
VHNNSRFAQVIMVVDVISISLKTFKFKTLLEVFLLQQSAVALVHYEMQHLLVVPGILPHNEVDTTDEKGTAHIQLQGHILVLCISVSKSLGDSVVVLQSLQKDMKVRLLQHGLLMVIQVEEQNKFEDVIHERAH